MPKIKVGRQSTYVDMTAMCDVAFLLLTFFILTAKFRPVEIVRIASPSSHAEDTVRQDVVTFIIDKDAKTYMSISKPEKKVAILNKFLELTKDKYHTPISETTKKLFARQELLGVPFSQLPQNVQYSSDKLTQLKENGQLEGIPTDTLNNELGDWIMAARYVYADQDNMDPPPIAIKGDRESNIKGVKRVIEILRKNDVHKYKLITTLENKYD